MPVSLEEVQKVVGEQFPGADVRGLTEKNHRVFGAIIWDGFKKLDTHARHQLLSERIRDRFGLRGINIGVLYLRAPGEKL